MQMLIDIINSENQENRDIIEDRNKQIHDLKTEIQELKDKNEKQQSEKREMSEQINAFKSLHLSLNKNFIEKSKYNILVK